MARKQVCAHVHLWRQQLEPRRDGAQRQIDDHVQWNRHAPNLVVAAERVVVEDLIGWTRQWRAQCSTNAEPKERLNEAKRARDVDQIGDGTQST
jgi:hypothetical protein